MVRQIAEDFDPTKVMIAVTFRELQGRGFHYGMVTNGYRLNAKMAQKLLDAGMGSISISMDAPNEINDRLRGKRL